MDLLKITNKVAFYSVSLLAYWVFIFVAMTVFEFKVFKENITQAFYLSIFGLLAVMGGAMILNVMLNLTKISEHFKGQEPDQIEPLRPWKRYLIIFSFPLIFSLLYLGDYSSSFKKKNILIGSAESLINEEEDLIEKLGNYKFSKEYVEETSSTLKLMGRIDESFPEATLILRDEIDGKRVLLIFSKWDHVGKDSKIKKVDFIFPTSEDERSYLNNVFDGKTEDYKFSAHDGNYELYFPVKTSNKDVVIRLSDRRRYGKLGS